MSEPTKAVFLSYASQDAEAAKRICDALRTAGVEVWFDQSELRGGDAWDAMIRKRIKECALFVPLISPVTNARAEGYFRLEWKLAVDRSHLMADDAPFLFPIVIGEVNDATARVPDKFREVQWTRLRLDETPAELAARITRLLASGVAGVADPGAGSTSPATGRRRKEKSGLGSWWWLVFPIMGMSVPIIKELKKSSPAESPAAVSAPDPKSQTPAPKPPSEARQLSVRARVMSLDKYDSSIDDYTAAEGLVKKALELDPNDAEIWAVSSLLNFGFNSRGFERTPARTAAARAHAERALKLAPDSTEALFALGRWQRDHEEAAVAETTLLKVLARNPDHSGALHNLGYLYDRMGRLDEAAALYAREARNPTAAPLAGFTEYLMYFRRGRFPEADTAVRKSIAAEPSANSQSGLALLLLTWKGDAEGAAAAVATGPVTLRREHRPIWVTAFAHLCRRKPDEALRALERLSDEFILDNWYTGPKAYWVGLAHAQAGRAEAARVAWEAGLGVVDGRLRNAPANAELRLARGELLALLGREPEALQEARTVEQLEGRDTIWIATPVRIHAALGRVENALKLIGPQLQFTLEHRNFGWPLTPALLRVDPRWDKIRSDPRFQKLCEEPPPPPRDWPKNRELKKAVALLDRLDAIPEDLRLAEEIVQGALDKAPTDPETVTAMARVQTTWLTRGWDRASERYLRAQRMAERAVQLAPDEPEALAALQAYLLQRGTDRPRARQLIERAIELDAGNARLHRLRNELLAADRTVPRAEVFAAIERTLAQFPGDALVHYDASRHYRGAARWEDCERETDAALAIAPVANAMVWKARMEFALHQDLRGMKAALDRVPARVRSIERTVFGYFIYAVMSQDFEVGVAALNEMAEPWMIDFDYRGPKALPLAALLELQGKPALARIQYEVALKQLIQRQVTEPDDLFLKLDEAWALHGLGRDEEARAAIRIHNESIERPYRVSRINSWWFHPIACNLILGERGTALALLREAGEVPAGSETVRRFLLTDPRLAAFRDDPEINALLGVPKAGK